MEKNFINLELVELINTIESTISNFPVGDDQAKGFIIDQILLSIKPHLDELEHKLSLWKGIIEPKPPKSQKDYNYINPDHYKRYSMEAIDMLLKLYGIETTISFCEMNALKYRLRMGSKPNEPIKRDLDKENWYLTKAKELRDLVNHQTGKRCSNCLHEKTLENCQDCINYSNYMPQ